MVWLSRIKPMQNQADLSTYRLSAASISHARGTFTQAILGADRIEAMDKGYEFLFNELLH
jgi:hypothetical protein